MMENEIRIDTSLIPPEVQEVLAKSALEMVKGILAQPGGREKIDAYKAAHNMM